jgi:hypothetical protein
VFVPETKLRVRSKIDLVGAALLGAGIGGVLIYLSDGATWAGPVHVAGLADRRHRTAGTVLRLGTRRRRADHGPKAPLAP